MTQRRRIDGEYNDRTRQQLEELKMIALNGYANEATLDDIKYFEERLAQAIPFYPSFPI